jgi:hypothetical protein
MGPRPINDEGLTFEFIQGNYTPIPAIKALITVITHNKNSILRNDNGPKTLVLVVYIQDRVLGFPEKLEIPLRTPQILISIFPYKFSFYFLVIHPKRVIFYLNFVSRNADNPFNEILFLVSRPLENNYITSLWFLNLQYEVVGKWYLNAIDELIHQDMITDKKSWLHGSGRDLKGLNNKCPNEERQKNGYYSCL